MTLLEYIESILEGTGVLDTATPGQVKFNREASYDMNEKISVWACLFINNLMDLFIKTGAMIEYSAEDPEDDGNIVLSQEQIKMLNTIQIIEDQETREFESWGVRYPYFRLRGKPITPEQAFEVIREIGNYPRTHQHSDSVEKPISLVDWAQSLNFNNNWIGEEDILPHHGWVHPDGTIGINNITTRHPHWAEFLYEMLGYVMAFPYLDFIVALTNWDNYPDYVWKQPWESRKKEEKDSDYPDFLEHIVYGIWVHDYTIELMEPARAKKKYQEYVTLYGVKDTSKYIIGYYKNKNLYNPEEYYKRCIEANRATEEMSQV